MPTGLLSRRSPYLRNGSSPMPTGLVSRRSPYLRKGSSPCRQAGCRGVRRTCAMAVRHADRLANAALFAHCRGVRRMRPNDKPAACEQAPSGWFFVCPRMAHCFAQFVHMWQRFCKAGIKDCIHFALRNKLQACILAFVRRGKPGLRNDVNRRAAGCNVSRAHSISKRVLIFFGLIFRITK